MKTKAVTTMMVTLFLASIFGMTFITPAKAQYLVDPCTVALWHLDKEFGTALDFNGVDDYVVVADHPSLGGMTELTVEAWIKWGGSTATAQYIVSKYLETGNQRGFIFGLHSDNTLRMWVSSDGTTASGNFDYLTSSYTPPVGSWIYVAGVFKGDSFIKLFVDGSEVASKTTTVSSIFDNTDVLYIGRYFTDRYHKGVIDEVRISNVARTTFDLSKPLTVDDNTVALWHFNEGSSNTVYDETLNNNVGAIYGATWVDSTLAIDSSPNGNFGTIHGASWVDNGKFDKALCFDGVNDYVEVPHSASLDITVAITVEAWIKADFVGGTIIRKGAWPIVDPPPTWGFDIQGSKLRAFIYDAGTPYIAYGATTLVVGSWYHVAFTYDGEDIRIYLNGVEDGSQHHIGDIDPTDAPIWISRKDGVNYFDGVIDEVRISNVARGPVDIDPNTLNLKSKGSWITAYIEVPGWTNLFEDDFEDGLAYGWTEGPGTWTVESGSYVYSKLDENTVQHTYSLITGLTVTDFIAEVKVKQLTTTYRDSGIQFWHQDSKNYYYANFDRDALGLWLFKGGSYVLVHSKSHTYDVTLWHTVKIAVHGTGFKMYVDGDLEWTDTLSDWFSGGIGVHAHRDSYTQFDDVIVTSYVSEVDLPTVNLYVGMDSVPAETDPKYSFVTDMYSYIADVDSDGILERMVKFPRANVGSLLIDCVGQEVLLTISGQYLDDARFCLSYTIRVIKPGK